MKNNDLNISKYEKIRKIIEKHQVFLFFFFSAFLGVFLPWLLLGEPLWFMFAMPITGIVFAAKFYKKEKYEWIKENEI